MYNYNADYSIVTDAWKMDNTTVAILDIWSLNNLNIGCIKEAGTELSPPVAVKGAGVGARFKEKKVRRSLTQCISM